MTLEAAGNGEQPRGTLTVVGTGIRAIAQITRESERAIRSADKVLYLVADPVTESWIESINSNASSLLPLYVEGRRLVDCYSEMVETILAAVRSGGRVCAVFYGHPGVFTYPSLEAIRRSREEGFEALMLPGVSAEDCLFADLEMDPGRHGCQSFEASGFLLQERRCDPSASLILWQVGALGSRVVLRARDTPKELLEMLVERLEQQYPSDHEVVVYEAALFRVARPVIRRVKLRDLCNEEVPGIATLYVPPLEPPKEDPVLKKRIEGLVQSAGD